jgi:hypothetical protein
MTLINEVDAFTDQQWLQQLEVFSQANYFQKFFCCCLNESLV